MTTVIRKLRPSDHGRPITDEDGVLRIDFRDGAVHLAAGEMFVIPKGVEHKPYAESEVRVLLIEPRGVPNTGDEGGDRNDHQDAIAMRHVQGPPSGQLLDTTHPNTTSCVMQLNAL